MDGRKVMDGRDCRPGWERAFTVTAGKPHGSCPQVSCLRVMKVTFPGGFGSQEMKGRVMSQERILREQSWFLT